MRELLPVARIDSVTHLRNPQVPRPRPQVWGNLGANRPGAPQTGGNEGDVYASTTYVAVRVYAGTGAGQCSCCSVHAVLYIIRIARSLARNLSVGGSCTVLKHFGELFVILQYLAMANRFH